MGLRRLQTLGLELSLYIMRDKALYEQYTDCLMAHLGCLITLQKLKLKCGLYRMTFATGLRRLGPLKALKVARIRRVSGPLTKEEAEWIVAYWPLLITLERMIVTKEAQVVSDQWKPWLAIEW